MHTLFRPISHSWVASHPNPIGVVEFIGGAMYGMVPHLAYAYFLSRLYEAGYSVIAVPTPPGFQHGAIAQGLLHERNTIRSLLQYPSDLPHIWVGHSLGCKYISLLEASGKIMDQPSLLIAPDISDTSDALPIPALSRLLDRWQLGANPTRRDTQALIESSPFFNLTALISFEDDTIAGNGSGAIAQSDVAWFLHALKNRQGAQILWHELPGQHREPIGVKLGDLVIRPNRTKPFVPIISRQLESLTCELLAKLVVFSQAASGTRVLVASSD